MARNSFDNITGIWIKDKNKHMKNAKVGKNMSKVKVIIKWLFLDCAYWN